MGSGLIYAIVIVVWVAYLVPSWLHRQDLGARSVHRYQKAMRVVSKGTEAEIVPTAAEREEMRALTRRRRMVVLMALASTLLLSTFFAAVGVLAVWIPALPLLASAIYVTNLRRVVVAERLAAARAMVARRSERDAMAPRLDAVSSALRGMPRSPTTIVPDAVAPIPSTTVRVRSDIAPTPSVWSPVDVPLPTYVTAPKAVRPSRVIDLTRPGEWTEAQKSAEEARLSAVAPSRDEVFDQVAAEEAVALVERLAAEERRAAGDA